MVVEKTTYRRVGTERLKQLDPRVRQLDEHNRYAMRRQCQRLRDTGAERPAVEPACGCEIGYHDRDMVKPPNHRRSPQVKCHPSGRWGHRAWCASAVAVDALGNEAIDCFEPAIADRVALKKGFMLRSR